MVNVKDIIETLIECNAIIDIDKRLLINNKEVGYLYERFNPAEWETFDDYLRDKERKPIKRYYLTNLTLTECERLNETQGFTFAYSELLGLYVLLIFRGLSC